MKAAIENIILEFLYKQLEGYINIALGHKLYAEQIQLHFEKTNCSFNVYVDDPDLKTEFDDYEDICELWHIHSDDLLYVCTHMDKEISLIEKNLYRYLNYKNQQK